MHHLNIYCYIAVSRIKVATVSWYRESNKLHHTVIQRVMFHDTANRDF